jgi:hypothetical protein
MPAPVKASTILLIQPIAMIAITFRDITGLWSRFKDYKPSSEYQEIHFAYCVKIQEAMGANDVNEALRLLTEGILFFNVPEDHGV